jgi:hypothetical protein
MMSIGMDTEVTRCSYINHRVCRISLRVLKASAFSDRCLKTLCFAASIFILDAVILNQGFVAVVLILLALFVFFPFATLATAAK